MTGELASVTIADSTPIEPQLGIGPSGKGWAAICELTDVADTSGTLAGDKLVIEVSDPGYTDDAVLTTRFSTLTGPTFSRRNHPNGG